MCLTVKRIPITKSEAILVRCFKRLNRDYNNFFTPFFPKIVPKDGILKEKDSKQTYFMYDLIGANHIHAYSIGASSYGKCRAYAINVKAYNLFFHELVCKFLYIPSADFSNKKNKRVKKLELLLKKGNDITWADILEIFPGNEEYFQYGQGYNIDVKKTRKDKNMRNNVVNWTQMVNETNLTKIDLLNFADGNMTRREFERFGGAARKAVRLLGANELRKRARKAASRLPV